MFGPFTVREYPGHCSITVGCPYCGRLDAACVITSYFNRRDDINPTSKETVHQREQDYQVAVLSRCHCHLARPVQP